MFENKKRIVFAPSCTHGTSLQHFAETRGDLFAYNAAGRTKSKIRVKDIWLRRCCTLQRRADNFRVCFFYVAYNASELPTGKIPMRTKGVWGSVSLGCKVRGSQGASRAEAERAQARCDRGSDILGRDHAERDRLENTGEEL